MNKNFNLKEAFKSSNIWESFKFSVEYKNGARVYICDNKTKYYIKGYEYDRTSAVIAKMVNDLIGEQEYNENVYGINGKFLSERGVGVESLINALKMIGVDLELIYYGKAYNVYNIDFRNIKKKNDTNNR